MIELLHIDCMEYMKGVPDKHFELAICDPPYNVGASDGTFGNGPGSYRKDLKNYTNHNETPDENYFKELFRISKNQIIWGSNYYPQYLYHSGAIIWLKKSGDDNKPLSDAEIAFQSFDKVVKVFKHNWSGFMKEPTDAGIKRIHPNQKPTRLYKYCLKRYAKEGDKIFDSHGGSMSLAIACHDMNFDLTLCEIDEYYYKAGVKRYNEHTLQLRMFKNSA